MNEYHFEEQHLVIAYTGEDFAGVLVTQPNETISLQDLLDYFYMAEPTFFVAQPVPELSEDEEINPENYQEKLSETLEWYVNTKFSEINDPNLLYIAKTIHIH